MSGVQELIRIHGDLEELKKNGVEVKKYFKKATDPILKAMQAKHDGKIYDFNQSCGGRETGRLEILMEGKNNIASLRFDYSPSKKSGEVIYARHLNTDNFRDMMAITPVLSVINSCAKKQGFVSGVDEHHMFWAKPIAVSFGGNYKPDQIPEVSKLITTVDNLLDFYLK